MMATDVSRHLTPGFDECVTFANCERYELGFVVLSGSVIETGPRIVPSEKT